MRALFDILTRNCQEIVNTWKIMFIVLLFCDLQNSHFFSSIVDIILFYSAFLLHFKGLACLANKYFSELEASWHLK